MILLRGLTETFLLEEDEIIQRVQDSDDFVLSVFY